MKYAVLAGKGTYDYNDYRGYGDNLVPVILARTPEGLCAADRIFGDVTGNDGLPEIAIGRLPAVTNAELQAMIDKIKAYENGQGSGRTGRCGSPTTPTAAAISPRAATAWRDWPRGSRAEKIYLTGSAAETRSRIIAAWNAGAALVDYCGHAGINQLAVENISVADAGAATAAGCRWRDVHLRGRPFRAAGVHLAGRGAGAQHKGGMAGGLMPSGAAMNADSVRLAENFTRPCTPARKRAPARRWSRP